MSFQNLIINSKKAVLSLEKTELPRRSATDCLGNIRQAVRSYTTPVPMRYSAFPSVAGAIFNIITDNIITYDVIYVKWVLGIRGM